MKQDILP